MDHLRHSGCAMISSPPQRSRQLPRRNRLAGSALELSFSSLTQKFRATAGERRLLAGSRAWTRMVSAITTSARQRVSRPERKLTGGLIVGNCAPDCALTRVYPRQTPSLTGKHRETSFGRQVVEAIGEEVLRYVSTSVERLAFQACLIDRSSISPFEINHLQARYRVTNDLCPNCAPTLLAPPNILTELRRSRDDLEQR